MDFKDLTDEIEKQKEYYDNIIAQARRIADIVNSKFIGDDEAKTYLNEGLASLYDKIIGTSCDWAVKTYTPTEEDIEEVVDGARTYWEITPPADFYKLRGISVRNGGARRDLKPYPKLEEYTYPQTAYRLGARNKIRIINPRTVERESILIEYFPPAKYYGSDDLILQQNTSGVEVSGDGIFNTYFLTPKYLIYGITKHFVGFFHNNNVGFRVTALKSLFPDERTGEINIESYDYYPQGAAEGKYCFFVGADDNWIYFFRIVSDSGYNAALCRTATSAPFVEVEDISSNWVPMLWAYGGGVVCGMKSTDLKNMQVVKYDGTDETVVYEYALGEGEAPFICAIPDLCVNAFGLDDLYVNSTFEAVLNKTGIKLTLRDVGSLNNLYFFNNKLYTDSNIVSFNVEAGTYKAQQSLLTGRTTPTDIKAEINYTARYDGKKNIIVTRLFDLPEIAPNTNAAFYFLSYYVAICFLLKQGKDASALQVKLSEIEQRIIRELDIDEHRPQTVGNDFRRGVYGWWI